MLRKQEAPATMRNRDPILAVLDEVLPAGGTVLEIASGTGEHAVYFAHRLTHIVWQPSDVDPVALESIEAYRLEAHLSNLRTPVRLDVRSQTWDVPEGISAIVCINMIHISPWEACEALMAGAGRHLPAGAPLVLYGPFRFDGQFTAPSNAAFDQSLRRQNASWGVRDLNDVTRAAELAGLTRSAVHALPANNHAIVFHKRLGE
jgi:hypothetical protein